MSDNDRVSRRRVRSVEENGELRRRLEEAEQTLAAIRKGDVDALAGAKQQELEAANENLRNANEDLLAQREQLQTANDMLEARQEQLEEAHAELEEQGRELARQAETLFASQERLALAASGTRIGMYDWNVATGEAFWTEQVSRLLGLRTTTTTVSQECHYHDWAERVHPEDWLRVEAEERRCMAERAPYETEYRVVWPDGSVHWIADRGVFQYDADGRCTRMLGILMDVTARKRAEEVLKVKDNAIASSLSAIAMGDPQGNLTYVNPAFLRLWRYENEREVLGKSVLDFWKEPQRATGVMQAIRDGGWIGELVAVTKDGQCLNVSLSASTVLNEVGTPLCMMASFVDITERKRAEEALRESEERYRTLIETAPDAIVVHRDGRFLYANSAALALTRAGSFERLARHTVLDLFRPEDREQAVERTRAAMAGNRLPMRQAVLLDLDGEEVPVEFHTAPVDYHGARAILTVIRDVTERTQAEEDIRRRAEELATLMDVTPTAVWVSIDPRCEVITGNRAAQRFYEAGAGDNLSAGAIGGPRDFARRFFQNGRELKPEELPMQVATAHAIDVRDAEIEVLLPSGRTITILGNASPLLDPEGRVRGSIAAFVDITDRKRAEEALRELNATLESKVAARTAELETERRRLYDVLESIPAMVCLLTPDYHVAFANRSFRKVFGEANGRRCYEFCYGRTEPCEFCETYNVLKTGKPHRWEVTAADGRTIIDAYDFPFTDVDGSPLILEMDIDITERKHAQAELQKLNETLERRARQLQKLTLELLQAEDRERRRIADILHEDLQQQMAAIKFHVAILAGRIKTDESLESMTSEIDEMLKKAIERSRSLSHELSPGVLHMNDMAEVLGWLAKHTRTQYGLTVHVRVYGDATLQSEATAMFLFRAAQEMLFNVVKHTGVREAGIQVRRHGRWVCMAVSDGGPGFDPEELKETSGFGLLGIRERVESLGGRMTIRSRNGQGSTFRIVIPDGQVVVTT